MRFGSAKCNRNILLCSENLLKLENMETVGQHMKAKKYQKLTIILNQGRNSFKKNKPKNFLRQLHFPQTTQQTCMVGRTRKPNFLAPKLKSKLQKKRSLACVSPPYPPHTDIGGQGILFKTPHSAGSSHFPAGTSPQPSWCELLGPNFS